MNARTCAAAAVLATAALLAGCGSGGQTSTATTAAATTAAATTTTPPTAAEPAAKTVEIAVANGTVDGGIVRVSVDRGTAVVLVVHADVSDEVHVHGYDLHGDVTPSQPARISFTADVPGRFEVELESRGLQIAQLEVGA